jgi:MBG domain (YGX type)/YDG domain
VTAVIKAGDITATGVTVNGNTETVAFQAVTGSYNDKSVALANTVSATVKSSDVDIGTASNGLDLGNYMLSNVNATQVVNNNASTITKASLSKIQGSKTYEGQVSSVTQGVNGGTLTITGVNNETATLKSNVSVAIDGPNAGTAKVTQAGLQSLSNNNLSGNVDVGNYDLSAVPGANSVTISPARLTQLSAAKTYDGLSTVKAAEVGTIHGVAGESFTATGGTADINSKDVASANKITSVQHLVLGSVNGSDTSNYDLSDAALPAQGAQSNSVAIKQAHLTQLSAAKTYDGLSTVKAAEVGTIQGVAGESFTANGGTADINSKDVASANKITSVQHLVLGSVNGSDTSNYDLGDAALPAQGAQSNSVDVGKAVLVLQLAAQSKVYDGSVVASIAAGDVLATGVQVNGQSESVAFKAVTGSYNSKDVLQANQVSATLVASDVNSATTSHGLDLGNYTLSNQGASQQVQGQGAIRKAVLTDLSGGKVYDGTLVLSGAQLTLIKGVAGETFVANAGDVVPIADKNVLAQGNKVTDVSSLHLTGTAAGSLASNYDLTRLPAANMVAVAPKPLTVAADAKSKVVDELDPALTWRLVDGSALVSGDALSGDLVRVSGEGVGSYTIGQGSLANSNYAITYKPGSLAIVGLVEAHLSTAALGQSVSTGAFKVAALSPEEQDALDDPGLSMRTVGAAVATENTQISNDNQSLAAADKPSSAGLLSAELPDELRPFKRVGAQRSQVWVERTGLRMPGVQNQLSGL